jgi:hypothetical protein
MPRAIWTGSIAFGLVSVPVRMTSAVAEHTLHFHYVHEPDGPRIGYEKVCKAEGKPVEDDEIVKAFEVEKDEWVYMSDEDFEAAGDRGLRPPSWQHSARASMRPRDAGRRSAAPGETGSRACRRRSSTSLRRRRTCRAAQTCPGTSSSTL